VPRGIARWGVNGEAAASGRPQGVAKWAKNILIVREKIRLYVLRIFKLLR